MPITVNLRHLEEHEIRLTGDLPLNELDLGVQDELIHLNHPLQYNLVVELLHDCVLARGSLLLPLDCECGRCLTKYRQDLKLPDWAVHLPLEGEEKVNVENDSIDLTPFVREDMLLEFPQHPLCKPDCSGLKKKQVSGPVAGAETPVADPWAALNQLKLK